MDPATDSQAIILATHDAPQGTASGPRKPVADMRVGGLTLLKRAILTLARKGVRRLAVVVADSAVRDRVVREADPRVAHLDIRWVVVSSDRRHEDGWSVMQGASALAPAMAPSAGVSLPREARGAEEFLVVAADRVFDPAIVERLLDRGPRGRRVAAAVQEGAYCGLLRGSSVLLEALSARATPGAPLMLAPVLQALEETGEAARLDVGAAYVQAVHDRRSRGQASSVLLASLRKPVDGVVARHVNRVFSLSVTRLLCNTPIRPNHVTIVSLATAFLGACASAQATASHPGWLVAGAALWQLASMLDGVDGELARLKFSGSKLGEWLDTLSDDAGRLVFFIGAGIGTSAVFGSPVWLVLLALAVTIQLGVMLTVYRKLRQTGSGSHFALTWDASADQPGPWSRFKAHTEFLSRRDTYIALWLVLAVLGLLKLAIVGTCAVTLGVLLNDVLSPRQVRAGFAPAPLRGTGAGPQGSAERCGSRALAPSR